MDIVIPIPIAIFATSLPILPNPTIPSVFPLSSAPLEYDFFNSSNLQSPSRGILLLEECKCLTHPNK